MADLFDKSQWKIVSKGNMGLVGLADRHYTRQTPGSNQCCRPGVNLCLMHSSGKAAWIVWRPIPCVGRMDNLEAWECTLFRNESNLLSSSLIESAVEVTHRQWGWPPRDGLITSVGIEETAKRRGKANQPGHCFIMAGWSPVGARKDKVWLITPHPHKVKQ